METIRKCTREVKKNGLVYGLALCAHRPETHHLLEDLYDTIVEEGRLAGTTVRCPEGCMNIMVVRTAEEV